MTRGISSLGTSKNIGVGIAAAIGVMAAAFATGAEAQSTHEHGASREAGTISMDADIELQNDWTVNASDSNERNDLTGEVELGVRYQATTELSLNLGLKWEQVTDPDPGEDSFFENHGAFVETLTVNYDTDRFGLFAGKFTPNFGLAWEISPGIYTKEFAEEDYKFTERWGFGGNVGIDGGIFGHVDLSASTFFVDRTFLSDSVITSRGRTTESSGGPGNTGDLSSFAVAIDGHEVPWMETLEYHLALIHQQKGEGDTASELGIVGGLHFTVALDDSLTFTPFAEYATFDGSDGVDGRQRQVLTLAARFDKGPWNLTLSHASRVVEESGADDAHDELGQISAGYLFDNGLLLEMGYGKLDDDSVVSDVLGVKLSYELAASSR